MNTYISMLRGINVGGQKKVRMGELKGLYESLGFGKVRTYIQSGNVLFEYRDTDRSSLVRKIERGIDDRFGFEVPVVIRTKDELQRVIANSPFAGKDDTKVHVTFLSAEPTGLTAEEISGAKDEAEEFSISGNEIYLFCPNGYGVTKLSNAFLERKLKVSATTRNWRTVKTLLSMAER
ncbi:MAG: DUF1697 domain-containing protein [Thaumarchaeota archaeon]|nr:DUF1697 domain-containing protein [Nitrososphaerota archaeon]